MSSSSSSFSGRESYTSGSNIKWHVLHANSPPHAPSNSISFSCAAAIKSVPTSTSTVFDVPSASTYVTETLFFSLSKVGDVDE
eukprot:CAMPEP_0170786136 /NCGR_PEP_ID=MMETSP0733-20121128/17391_1 /TAXON_ID=186038 /ORGANISM="Fragilariopsis kerguelensis, Strain L26-C5" /LENGTH=82 /DNA_ID=CAMNT_0011131861 /DNA_START=154 /DNA_END=402 /DNA_ORIENTATION=+